MTGVHLHTHLAETEDEQAFCLQKFGYRPVPYMQSVDWVGPDVWFVHAVDVDHEEVKTFANMAPAWRTARPRICGWLPGSRRVNKYLAAGVKVGLGVDGSASNDGSHLLAEARQAMLLSRLREGITGFSLSNDPAREFNDRPHSPGSWRHAAGRPCWAVRTLARSKPAGARISLPST